MREMMMMMMMSAETEAEPKRPGREVQKSEVVIEVTDVMMHESRVMHPVVHNQLLRMKVIVEVDRVVHVPMNIDVITIEIAAKREFRRRAGAPIPPAQVVGMPDQLSIPLIAIEIAEDFWIAPVDRAAR